MMWSPAWSSDKLSIAAQGTRGTTATDTEVYGSRAAVGLAIDKAEPQRSSHLGPHWFPDDSPD